MGLFDWLRSRKSASAQEGDVTEGAAAASGAESRDGDGWEELPSYVPADPSEHMHAVVIASAIAANAREQSAMTLRSVKVANPEYQTVACIASAIAAGALEQSTLVVKKIYKKTATEENNAA